jgi:hypothetical protein
MRQGHAIALAIGLAGWYLMFPPTSHDYPMGDANAPLTQWAKRPTIYRTEQECEHVLDRQIRLKDARNRQVQVRFYKQARCVATGDPRLKQQ